MAEIEESGKGIAFNQAMRQIEKALAGLPESDQLGILVAMLGHHIGASVTTAEQLETAKALACEEVVAVAQETFAEIERRLGGAQ